MSDLKEFLKLLQRENEDELERCIHDYDKFGYNFALDRKWKFDKFIKELEGVKE